MQQRRQTEDASGSGGMPRRSLMMPFLAQPGDPFHQTPHPQPQAASFPQYPLPMEPSMRSYQHQQLTQQMPPERHYWQPPTGMDASSYAKQRRHGDSMDLGEFGGMLDPDTAPGVNESATSGRTPSDAVSEISVASFDVNSLHDSMTGSASASTEDTGGFQPPVTTTSMHSGPPTTPPKPKQARLTTNRKSTASTRPSSDVATKALVDAAYAQLNESSVLDLKADELSKDRSERCQFPDCPNRARVSQSYGKFCNRHVIVAPCGFPGCRDKAMDRAAMCAKHLEQGKEALQEILKARSQNVPVCKTSGCFKNDQGRGYCRGHEKLLMATGRLPPHVNKRRLNSAYTMCSYPDCPKHSQRNHLCRTHGNLIIKQAQELADRPGATESYEEVLARMQKEIRRCTHENCSKNSQRDRLCTTHYFEKHHLQKESSTSASSTKRKADSGKPKRAKSKNDSDVRAVKDTGCGKPGCGNLSYSAGLCVEHTRELQNLSQNQNRYGDPFPSGESSGIFSGDVDSEAKPGVFGLNEKPLAVDAPQPSDMSSTELAEAAAVAAAAADAKHASPPTSGKARKYYCRADGCGKQAHRQNLCKRHYRLQEGISAGKLQPDASSGGPLSNYMPGVQQMGFEQPTISCQFPSCSQIACGGTMLCLAHSKATFCWQPGCENLVGYQQFCEFHAFRQQCAFEGCMYSAESNYSGCANHMVARKCRHDFCDKFAVGSDSDWCRLHQISCQNAPCVLCKLHALPLSFQTFPSFKLVTSRRSHRLAAAMERIYSAFFTLERRRESPKLTAAVLELHNETQKSQRQPPFMRPGGDGVSRRPDTENESLHEAKRHASARRQDMQNMVMSWTSVKKDLEAACQAAARAFLLAYGAKAFTAVLLASRKWSSLEYGYADAARLLLKGDTLRFGAFFGSLVGIFRVTELAARAARGGERDAVNLAIAGAVSGSALLLDSPSRRSTISLYIFVRMLDVGYYHWICRIGAVNHHGLEYTIRQRMRGQLDTHGNPLPFRLCQPHYHIRRLNLSFAPPAMLSIEILPQHRWLLVYVYF
ncbi:uncharacterized protein PITG_03408 [Phytophthora infestans T30-4]|uniref:Uncharacterized protein n=1 Tax=Phytophthora infestans (strain T30-4) TaxID=403677 RepID=D0N066_PHYIT|nr:uncharacterized protein PITG_03408 [Phytophthora infestans T30-4]EEY65879.1 conserved hypothetical protein [Phytophthora infestans T30-4]|eukprot:XP_002906478.1 conserved hypothetical protein [Phytophthora infestans T30-4]